MPPDPLQEHSKERPHLWSYLHELNVEEVGVPQYIPMLSGEHKDIEKPNLVYPAGDSGIFIHIMFDSEDARDFYIAIEPNKAPDLQELLDEVDARLVDYVDALQEADDPEKRTQVLIDLVNEICEVGETNGSGLWGLFRKASSKVKVNPVQLEGIRYMIVRDKLGMGPLEPLIVDPNIEALQSV